MICTENHEGETYILNRDTGEMERQPPCEERAVLKCTWHDIDAHGDIDGNLVDPPDVMYLCPKHLDYWRERIRKEGAELWMEQPLPEISEGPP